MRNFKIIIFTLIIVLLGTIVYLFIKTNKVEKFTETPLTNDSNTIVQKIMAGEYNNNNILSLVKSGKLKVEDLDKIVSVISQKI